MDDITWAISLFNCFLPHTHELPLFELLENMQDERAKQIFKMRYFEDKKNIAWAIIGKKLNISTQTAINIHNKTIDFLKKKLKSKNCFDKI